MIDGEHGRRGAIFWSHVGDGGAIAERQSTGAFSMEFEVGADHLLLAQKFGQGQYQVGCRQVGRQLAGELDADDFRQTHPGGAPEHDVLGLKPSHADGNHAQCVHMRGVAVGADTGVRVGHAVIVVYHGRHLLQVDLVHDAVARRDDIDVLERFLGPVDEMEAVFVAAILDGPVAFERLGIIAATLDGQ